MFQVNSSSSALALRAAQLATLANSNLGKSLGQGQCVSTSQVALNQLNTQ